MAEAEAGRASQAAMEELNARGILPSTITSDRLAQIRQRSAESVAGMIPGLYQAAMQERQAQIGNLGTSLNALMALQQAVQSQEQAQWQRGLQEAGLTGEYMGAPTWQAAQAERQWERQGEADQWARALQEAGLTGMWQGQPTWERQYQERQLAQAAARASSGGSRGGLTLTERTRSSYGEALQGVADSLDALKQAYGSQDYADMFSTEYGMLAPVQVIEQQINSQRAQLRAQGIDPDKLIDEAYKMAYGVGRDEYWKQANKALEGEF
ncbi:MAG TPA: hypothetical protein DCY27_10660 [Desulfobacterales bacterium]|nr:hypothetical protein [Desulfobacterales bacterium]